jgi:hypothetical protein
MATLMLFFDGVGIGENDPSTNPFAAIGAKRLGVVAGGTAGDGAGLVALDAGLGVPGLPQSATGQTTLLTGVNAPRFCGQHRIGLPGPTLWPVLENESLFLKLKQAGKRPTFANAYTREHLEAKRPRWSASTRAVKAAGLQFRMWDKEGLADKALFHDYTGEWPRRRGYAMREHDAASAAAVLCELLDDHDFVLYEYFLTDLAAHRGTWQDKLEQARRVEALVDEVLQRLDLGKHRVVVTSDHGNLEAGDHKRHTVNRVPFLVWGQNRDRLLAQVDAMTDVTPALVRA